MGMKGERGEMKDKPENIIPALIFAGSWLH